MSLPLHTADMYFVYVSLQKSPIIAMVNVPRTSDLLSLAWSPQVRRELRAQARSKIYNELLARAHADVESAAEGQDRNETKMPVREHLILADGSTLGAWNLKTSKSLLTLRGAQAVATVARPSNHCRPIPIQRYSDHESESPVARKDFDGGCNKIVVVEISTRRYMCLG